MCANHAGFHHGCGLVRDCQKAWRRNNFCLFPLILSASNPCICLTPHGYSYHVNDLYCNVPVSFWAVLRGFWSALTRTCDLGSVKLATPQSHVYATPSHPIADLGQSQTYSSALGGICAHHCQDQFGLPVWHLILAISLWNIRHRLWSLRSKQECTWAQFLTCASSRSIADDLYLERIMKASSCLLPSTFFACLAIRFFSFHSLTVMLQPGRKLTFFAHRTRSAAVEAPHWLFGKSFHFRRHSNTHCRWSWSRRRTSSHCLQCYWSSNDLSDKVGNPYWYRWAGSEDCHQD